MKHQDHRAAASTQHGFTLIELMIVVVIIAIISAIAVPAYRNHVIKANRASAESFMMQIANTQEQYKLDARSYAQQWAVGGTPSTLNLTAPGDVQRNYTISLSVNNAPGSAPWYTITAAPTASQADVSCGTIAIDNLGNKGSLCTSANVSASPITSASCPGPVAACW